MTRSSFFSPILAGLAFALIIAAAPAAVARDLNMYIENQSAVIIYSDGHNNAGTFPDSIPPGWTSQAIKPNDSSKGYITYVNDIDQSQATCSATLHWNYQWNGLTGQCDDKKFDLSTSSDSCSLVRDGDCYGAGSCSCNFIYNQQ